MIAEEWSLITAGALGFGHLTFVEVCLFACSRTNGGAVGRTSSWSASVLDRMLFISSSSCSAGRVFTAMIFLVCSLFSCLFFAELNSEFSRMLRSGVRLLQER